MQKLIGLANSLRKEDSLQTKQRRKWNQKLWGWLFLISKNFKLKHAHHDTLNFVFYLNITLDRKFDLEQLLLETVYLLSICGYHLYHPMKILIYSFDRGGKSTFFSLGMSHHSPPIGQLAFSALCNCTRQIAARIWFTTATVILSIQRWIVHRIVC